MNNIKQAFNIISKIDFKDYENGSKPTTINDSNKSVGLVWSAQDSNFGEIKEVNGVKILDFKSYNYKLTNTGSNIYGTELKSGCLQFEADILIPNMKADNIFFNISGNSSATGFRFNIKNTFKSGLEIFCNNKKVVFNYQFVQNKKYNIVVSKNYNVYSLYIDGLIVGHCVSDDFTNNINISTISYVYMTIGGRHTSVSNFVEEFVGEMSNINISFGNYVKYNNSFTKYGDNLVSRLNFANLALPTSTTVFTPNLEAVTDSKMNWSYDNLTIKNDYATVDGTPFESNISNINTIYFTVNNNNKIYNEIELLSFNDKYKIIYTSNFEGEPEPQVVVNEKTTSALNFENGLTDKIETTIWSKEGNGNVQNVNKIFGDNSFETKALGDSLYTNSNVITGGATPFTIEGYYLFRPDFNTTSTGTDLSLFSLCNDSGYYQGYFLSKSLMNIGTYRAIQFSKPILDDSFINKRKIKVNEINKITISYDGSALRSFINDELDGIYGTSVGLEKSSQPLRLMSYNFNTSKNTTSGIIDNINIHDGIATKVRDYDHYEEYLVVDLAFDGENNSTKIVDNGSLKSNWTVNGNAKISTDQKFDGFSSLYIPYSNNDRNVTSRSDIIFENGEDFTFSFEFIRLASSVTFSTIFTTGVINTLNSSNVWSINAFSSYYNNNSFSMLRDKVSFINEKNFNKIEDGIVSNITIQNNVKYKVDIVRNGRTTFLYINNVLDSSTDAFQNDRIDFSNLCIGTPMWSNGAQAGISCYLKNVKIYKGVAVIPENPTGKIQLDFDNNVIDKYGNSTWTNNGVTFDQVNSVKGYSAYFNGNAYLLSTTNTLLNFENKNFNIEFDGNKINNNYTYSSWLHPNGASYPSQWCELSSWNTNLQRFQNLAASAPELTGAVLNLNTWYKWQLTRNNGTVILKANDVVTGIVNYTSSMNVNFNAGSGTRIIGSSFNSMACYLDNFKTEKDYKGEIIIDKPAVHLPLETNATNIGFTPLTINSVGNPTYTTIDGKKCIKFESGKYLTINSNNIFNLGTNSDFYMEFNVNLISFLTYNMLLTNNNSWTTGSQSIWITNQGKIYIQDYNLGVIYESLVGIQLNTWNKIIILRKNSIIKVIINDITETANKNINLNLSINNCYIGCSGWATTNDRLNGYMTNFKIFVGTSEIPETYNDKKVLDLDFKPTGKSYLFKDNNNKCVIHPVNITQRDYQDSQYCCSFNGTNQYLQLGKNDLFNFGLDDFVIDMIVQINDIDIMTNKDDIILSNGFSWVSGYFGISRYRQTNKLSIGMYGTTGWSSSNSFINGINTITIKKTLNVLSIVLNGVETLFSGVTNEFNLNGNSNTRIGYAWDSSDTYFKGSIYSIKVLRNTTDLSLLEEEKVIYSSDEKFVLTNGEEAEEISFTEIKERDIKVINDNDKITFKIDDNEVELAKTTEVDNIKLFDGYTSKIKDIRVYDIAMYDDDEFLGSELIDTQYPELEFHDDSDIQELQVIDVGEYVIKGFIEGGVDRKYIIRNKVENFDLLKGSGDYYYDGIDERYIDDYEIYEIESKQRYTLYKHEMKKGYISGTVNIANCGLKKGQKLKVYCYRNDTQRLIGEYELDDYNRYEIPNLDVNSKYDIIFKDESRKIENISSSYRTPKEY